MVTFKKYRCPYCGRFEHFKGVKKVPFKKASTLQCTFCLGTACFSSSGKLIFHSGLALVIGGSVITPVAGLLGLTLGTIAIILGGILIYIAISREKLVPHEDCSIIRKVSANEMSLSPEKAIGNYPIATPGMSQYEYQIGSTLIFVQYPTANSVTPYLDRAQNMIQAVWDDIPNAILYAEQVFKSGHPDGWEIYYKKKYPETEYRTGHWLIVIGITFSADQNNPVYYISTDPSAHHNLVVFDTEDYEKDYPKEFSLNDSPCMNIQRLSKNTFEVIS